MEKCDVSKLTTDEWEMELIVTTPAGVNNQQMLGGPKQL